MAEGPTGEFIAFDLETTGLDARFDRIVEIGGVRFDASGREFGRFEQLIDPERPMPPSAYAVHRISDLDVRGAPKAHEVLPEFMSFLGDPAKATLLAHNASFDAGFLACELARMGQQAPGHVVVDTLALARKRLPGLRSHRLDILARVLDLDPDGPHRALADSLRVKGIWLALAGGRQAPEAHFGYPLVAGSRSAAVPVGFSAIEAAMRSGARVRIEYSGGTRGPAPRDVTPRRFVTRGGVSYLVAMCHCDEHEKEFRLDRVLGFQVMG
jgi:DNA polymerase III epsilon subunit family exonuclease